MRKISIFLLIMSCIFIACEKNDPENDLHENDINLNAKQKLFKNFWKDFDENYVGFSLVNIDWDSVYTKHIHEIDENISDSLLFQILASSLSCLKDGHADIYAEKLQLAYSYFNEFRRQKPLNILTWNVSSTYLTDIVYVNNAMAYGKLKESNIGYFIITTFSANENDYYSIDDFISKYQDADGIIFDIRRNGGGNELYARIVASRLITEWQRYRQYKERIGEGRYDLSDFRHVGFEPAGKTKFEGKVIFLTSRTTYSSAEDFSLMLKARPNTVQVGDTTWGGASTHPTWRTLSNGWKYRLPLHINYDLKGNTIKQGIIPDYAINISKLDSIAGVDRIIEKAIEVINE